MPTNHIATCKLRVATLGREEAIAKSWPDEKKPNTMAYQADKLAKHSEVPKATVTLMRKLVEELNIMKILLPRLRLMLLDIARQNHRHPYLII